LSTPAFVAFMASEPPMAALAREPSTRGFGLFFSGF